MVKHIVFWRLKEEYEGRTKKVLAEEIKEALEAMGKKIPEVQHLEVGIDEERSDAASDIVLYSEFETWEDLRIYQDHPEHVKFKQFVMNRRTERRVVDYEL